MAERASTVPANSQRRHRGKLSFRAVNKRGRAGFDPGLQRHHLLPRQLLSHPSFVSLIASVGQDRIGFDDFRRNGILLPATETAALTLGLPMHRGPHLRYNNLVIERVGQIEAGWSALKRCEPENATAAAVMRLHLLQRALRRQLFERNSGSYRLNRNQPAGKARDFSELDAMADLLWPETEI